MQKKKEILPEYTEKEVCSIFRRQADKTQGVRILSELTGWSKQRIEDILIEGGYKIHRSRYARNGAKSRIIDEVALSMYNEGYEDADIAKEFNVAANTIKTWRVTNKLPSQFHKRIAKLHAKIDKLWDAKCGLTKIAKVTGTTEDGVRQYLKRTGRWKNDV